MVISPIVPIMHVDSAIREFVKKTRFENGVYQFVRIARIFNLVRYILVGDSAYAAVRMLFARYVPDGLHESKREWRADVKVLR